MVQFSKRDDGIGSRIRAISGRFTRRDAIYLLREVRRVVGRAPKSGRCHSLSNFPICPTVGMGCGDRAASARCGLRALHGGMWAVLSALSIAAMLFAGLAPVEKMMRGFTVEGGSDTAARAVSSCSLWYRRIR